MNEAHSPTRSLFIVEQGARLNRLAATYLGDVNAAHLMVHDVIAGAIRSETRPSAAALDAELKRLCARVN